MRVSVDRSDPGYCEDGEVLAGIIVLFDGAKLPRGCITADEETGEVVVPKLDAEGRFIVRPGADEFERETLRGKVEIRFAARSLAREGAVRC